MVFSQLQQPISPPDWEVRLRKCKGRVHHYENSDLSSDFCLEPTLDQTGFYMTSCKAGVRRGDLIRINGGQGFSEYQVDEIDFYSDPADMWIAKLHTV